jgi:radical SAM protein with 4Fe4S-binding SPASM domain
MNHLLLEKTKVFVKRTLHDMLGRLRPLGPVVEGMAIRPIRIHFELTNLCNANCIFCPYQFQTRPIEFMKEDVFRKAVDDYVQLGGGPVGFTPVVGESLIDPHFLDRVRYLRSFPSITEIFITTNGILLDKHGIENVVTSGLTRINLSTAGFQEEMYERLYRVESYQRMRRNVLTLLEENAKRGNPIKVNLWLRPDRDIGAVMSDPDFQPILAYQPHIEFVWAFASARGKITREILPKPMRLRRPRVGKETCFYMFQGPVILEDGTVQACYRAPQTMDSRDLVIGNVMRSSLGEIWTSYQMRRLRESFQQGCAAETCRQCGLYENLATLRGPEGRKMARENRARFEARPPVSGKAAPLVPVMDG